ncbi:MAG TPA: ATP-binding protein [Candidatus Paceibacterota bacterium]|nr:ATP-binding protein [Candidatus Paceibacterota bacterium]
MPPFLPNNPSGTYAVRFILLGLVYAGVAWLSLTFIPSGASGASLVWPVAAVGLAGLIFWGLNLWPSLLLSMFVVLMVRGFEPSLATGVSLGNTLEALAGAYILLRAGFHPLMSRLRDTLGLILASFIATFISALVIAGSAAIYFAHAIDANLLVGIWIGHTVSLLSFAPFVIRWGYRPMFTKTAREIMVGLVIFGSIGVINFLVFWTPYSSVVGISLIYILILPLIWASLRTGPRGTGLALIMTAVIGLSGILWGYGPITAHAVDALFGIQVLIGTLSLIFLLFSSITEERKEAVITLEGHVGQLENALEKISLEDKAKAEFIAILAHELRNPLSPVLSGLEILKTQEAGPADVLQMMGAHLNTLARLLDDLLDITRISQQKFKLEREVASLNDIIERSLEMAGPYMNERKHMFSKSLPAEAIWIEADPVRLTQVFVNLLNNAAKYTPPGGTISLSLAREGNKAVVRVQDNGQGIAPKRMQKIFEPFAGGAQRSQGPGGLHIGLSLAKRMTELHQGHIEARSRGAGKGSEFIVELPLPATLQTPLTAGPQKEQRGRFSRSTMESLVRAVGPISVLVVDDNEAAANMLGTLLEHNGHSVSIAHNGYDALEKAQTLRPHVALLDIGLPDIDGYEVARRMRATFGDDISLVALTGYGQQDDKAHAQAAGFNDHLVKPVSIVDVERSLANLKKV